jgi:nucleotide-binding universal stress UspA family protein
VIVVGSSVRGRMASVMLGSVPIGLVRRSKRPVLVITGPNS